MAKFVLGRPKKKGKAKGNPFAKAPGSAAKAGAKPNPFAAFLGKKGGGKKKMFGK
jgi:hypothetical protein